MTATAYDDLHDDVVVTALHELRATRKQRRLGDWNVIDALYRAYVAAIVGGLGVTLLSGVVGDRRVVGAQLQDLREVGPAAVGLVIAVAIAVGLRGGARGGPLALEAAEVRYVLLAPVDRDIALRAPARRQLRFTAFVGMVVGATVGLLAYRRLPGNPLSWIGAVAVVGTAAAVAMTGAAMVASGRRLGRVVTTALGVALVAWSALDVVLRAMTSPASLVGRLALWPLDLASERGIDAIDPIALAGLVPVAMLAVVGLRTVGGVSLEAAERRGRLVSHLRFAATFQDLRTVMLLRRQLASEVPRSRPRIRLRPSAGSRRITWRRDWRGILRWPTSRLLRLGMLGVVASLSTAAAWTGTTPLVLVAGAALYVAALDAVEGLAQEVDHPDRRDSFPHADGAINLRHLAAPSVVLSIAGLLGVGAAAAIAGADAALVAQIGLPLVVPSAVMAAGAAAVSTLRQPPDPMRLMMDSTGTMLLFHHALPPALAMIGPAATLLVRYNLDRQPDASPLGASVSAGLNVAMLAVLVLGWVRHRRAIAAYLAGNGTAELGK